MNDDSWQSELRQSLTNVGELCRILKIPPCADHADYPLLVPRPFADLMERRNPNDPLLLQVLPQTEEHQTAPGFSKDPLGEIADADGGIVLNKYTGRTLLLVSQECAVHCRFCFRRHFPKTLTTADGGLQTAADFLSAICCQSLPLQEEVILSGGDPLMFDDEALDRLLRSILQMKHVRRIRIHSRLPIVLPSRLTAKLAEILTLPIPVYLVLHVNHPNELSAEFLERRELLVKPVVMTQSVLLRRINDHAETLYRLFHRLIDARILPYYLHHLDKVEGAAHFAVSSEEGLKILAELRQRLPGYAVPTYVREINGQPCKEIIGGI
jgi:EF-P beta-lysylation protein EpmB